MIYILRLWIIASRDGANKLQSQDELTIHDGLKFFMKGYLFLSSDEKNLQYYFDIGSGIPEAETFGRKGKFSAFGFGRQN